MLKRMSLLTTAFTVASIFAGVAYAQQQTLVINSYGGNYEATQRKVVIEPFEKANNVQVKVITSLSGDTLAQLRAQKATPQYDIVQFSGGQEVIAAKEGLIAPITLDDLPMNGKNLYPFATAGLVKGEGPVIMLSAVGLAYNTEKAPKKPTAWADLWDKAYADHIVLTDLSNTLGLSTFLMINQTKGGNLENPEKGFAAISEIVDSSVMVTTSPEVQQNFAQNDAWIAPLSAEYAFILRTAGLPIGFVSPQEGVVGNYLTANLVANRPNQTLAKKFLDFSLSPEVQAAWAKEMRYSPTNSKTKLDGQLAAEVFYGEQSVGKLVHFDPAEVSAARPALLDRWKSLIAK